MTNPATMTPPDIDAILNDLSHQRAKLITRAESLRTAAHHARTGRFPNENRAAVFDAQADEYTPQIAAIADQIKPYNDEFDRRGGWTRAFLVQNTGGHVHASMSCSTCYPTTRYAWLTDYSGKDEDQIVYAAGELACTTCYPSAPTEVLTRVGEIRRPTDLEREQRAAEKATKNAQRAAAAVLDPTTGKTLYKTDRAASNAIAAALGDLHWYGDDHPSAHEWKATVDTAVAALAAKQGLDKDTVMSDYREKADKKFAATARKSLRELKQHRGDIVVDDLMPGLQAWIRDNGIPA
ncbi:hypothetical protein [Mycobacterium avium]|uniref:Uncharacterized protein n=1 Tax=Mycobacterium avium subsp. hominissuis TaxID=439334 RepID=A0AAI8SQK8_MYCAV|nr:hypothetical protein [Mycobacterium avium]PBA08614.1 hypothetical protein CKJ70_25590 [Mycobacterium avium]BBN50888.1 hypothetical protein JPH1_53630 [Mycobacterium avium subsp. hominissuis]